MLGDKLKDAHNRLPKPAIMVIGDLMLDHYIFGSATRLSPEAPVPVVNVKNENKIIGGAANVASNLIDLGATVYLAGITGEDASGKDIKDILDQKGIGSNLVLNDLGRTTTVKTRVIASNHQIVRIDQENTHDIAAGLEDGFFASLLSSIEKSDIIILSDYNKGLLTPSLSQRIIGYCNERQKRVIVDPKGLDYSKYKGAYMIKPNRKELAEAAKTDKIQSQHELEAAAKVIFEATVAQYLIVTLSENGIAIITPDSSTILPVVANQVYDVTGAGDTVVATLAYCTALGFGIEEACEIANYAASIVIKHIGSATTNIDEILTALNN